MTVVGRIIDGSPSFVFVNWEPMWWNFLRKRDLNIQIPSALKKKVISWLNQTSGRDHGSMLPWVPSLSLSFGFSGKYSKGVIIFFF